MLNHKIILTNRAKSAENNHFTIETDSKSQKHPLIFFVVFSKYSTFVKHILITASKSTL